MILYCMILYTTLSPGLTSTCGYNMFSHGALYCLTIQLVTTGWPGNILYLILFVSDKIDHNEGKTEKEFPFLHIQGQAWHI